MYVDKTIYFYFSFLISLQIMEHSQNMKSHTFIYYEYTYTINKVCKFIFDETLILFYIKLPFMKMFKLKILIKMAHYQPRSHHQPIFSPLFYASIFGSISDSEMILFLDMSMKQKCLQRWNVFWPDEIHHLLELVDECLQKSMLECEMVTKGDIPLSMRIKILQNA